MTKAVKITYSNYNFQTVERLVIGTKNISKAIKAVKEHEGSRRVANIKAMSTVAMEDAREDIMNIIID